MSSKPFPKRKRKDDVKKLALQWLNYAEYALDEDKRPFGDSDGGNGFVRETLGIEYPEGSEEEGDYTIEEEFCDELSEYTDEILKAVPAYIASLIKKDRKR